ncbi:MAG TPA: hypothetical protein PKU95_03365 [Candidatus Dojkabacteria bacterium]|nr:hypothetical protein [Candidatus Dojkabacteria bacterium]
MSKKKVLTILGASALGTALFVGTAYLTLQSVSALIGLGNGEYPDLIKNLAAKFNADPAEVEQVFEDTHDQMISSRLDEAVADGEISAEQKTLILNKMDEVQAKMEEINNQEMTATERRDALESLHDELRDWADENDIPLMFLMGNRRGMGDMMERGMVRGGMRGRF